MRNFAILLTTLFIGLKLTGYINWSWIWVASPIWIWAGWVIFLIIVLALCAGIVAVLK